RGRHRETIIKPDLAVDFVGGQLLRQSLLRGGIFGMKDRTMKLVVCSADLNLLRRHVAQTARHFLRFTLDPPGYQRALIRIRLECHLLTCSRKSVGISAI